jgi:hypothetical protein
MFPLGETVGETIYGRRSNTTRFGTPRYGSPEEHLEKMQAIAEGLKRENGRVREVIEELERLERLSKIKELIKEVLSLKGYSPLNPAIHAIPPSSEVLLDREKDKEEERDNKR